MFISLNVVSIAHVFCASLSLAATVWRILDILTRVSDLVPLILLIFCVPVLSAGLNGVTGIFAIGTVDFGVDGIGSTFGRDDGIAADDAGGGGGGGATAAAVLGFSITFKEIVLRSSVACNFF